VWSAKDKKVSDGCGARFGCWVCQRGGGTDKSMENMLYEEVDGKAQPVERYAYMLNLNRIQRFLAAKQWSWADRHPIGRTIYAGGYLKIAPDVFSPSFLARLLHICCTADKIEDDRAEEVAFQLAIGAIEDTAYNRRMSKPQFRIVSPAQLMHISFLWDFHCFNSRPFYAVEIYRRVWECNEYDFVSDDDLISVPQTPIPPEFWLKLPRQQWGSSELTDGLSDPMLSSVYFDGQNDPRAAEEVKTSEGPRLLVPVTREKEMEIDQEAASWIIWSEYDRLRGDIDDGFMTNSAATQFLLRYGVVSLSPGAIASMHRMAQRGQTYRELGLAGEHSMFDLFCRSDLQIVSKAQYHNELTRKLLSKYRQAKRWFWLGFTISYHLHNATELGQAIAQQVTAEQEVAAMIRHKTRVQQAAFGLECNVSTILAIRSAWIADPTSNKYGQQLIRRYRTAIINLLLQLSESEMADARIMLDVMLVDILNRIEAGRKQVISNVVQDAVNVGARSVTRMVHVFRRMLDNLIGSTKIHNNKRKKQCHNKKAIGAERNIQQNQLQFDMAV
jgi:DNA sulfur modification protein DndC